MLSADVAEKGGFENPLTRVEEEAKALDRLTVLGAKRAVVWRVANAP